MNPTDCDAPFEAFTEALQDIEAQEKSMQQVKGFLADCAQLEQLIKASMAARLANRQVFCT